MSSSDTIKKAVANEYTVTADVTLYARWTHTLALDANGGTATGTTSLTVKQADPILTLPTASDAGLTRSGYTFVCWNTETDGSGQSYCAGESKYVRASFWGTKRLYAMWVQGTGDTMKVATAKNIESVLKNINNGDTFVYADAFPSASNTSFNLPTLFKTYLSDESKLITLNLEYASFWMPQNRVSSTGIESNESQADRLKNYFNGCKSIRTLIININSMSEYMFSNCTSLTNVSLGKEVAGNYGSIYKGVFLGCTALTSVSFSDTTGWYTTSDASTTIDVSNASINATNLKSSDGSWASEVLRKKSS